MTASPVLLIDLAGVARLAGVQRPVASVWRSRLASTADPFPPAVAQKAGRPFFDALSVAHWLTRTRHGNNPHAVADAAASGVPAGFDVSETSHVAAVDALLALNAGSDEPCGGVDAADLHVRTSAADPDDTCLTSEIATASPGWAEWADQLSDAAFSPAGASELLERRHAATTSAAGPAALWTAEADDVIAEVVVAMAQGRRMQLILDGAIAPSFAVDLIARLGDDVDVVVPPSPNGRAIRRRMLCEALPAPASQPADTTAALHLIRVPSVDVPTTADALGVVEELAVRLRRDDRALVIAPAGVLSDSLRARESLTRTEILRTGLVRAVVRLPEGLIAAAPRQALGLWLLGRETGDVAIAERYTAIADLTGRPLTTGSSADLTSDLVAALGGRRDLFAHAFRFARLVRTSSLAASTGPLVASAKQASARGTSRQELPALLDRAHRRLGTDAPAMPAQIDEATVPTASISELAADRHLRLIAGIRLDDSEITRTGHVVVGIDDLVDPASVGERHVDRMSFAARHTSARLTAPGDVIFRTSPTPRAWVDRDGAKVVESPARVLRIDAADPGGLVADLVVADISRAAGGGPGSWRGWKLRRVPPARRLPLQAALADLAERRAALQQRIDALDEYADILFAGVVAGVVTPTAPAAPAASDQK